MIRVDKLRGIIAERGLSGAKVAQMLGITPKTFYCKMQKGVFGSDEIDAMVDFLKIDRPEEIFFAKR